MTSLCIIGVSHGIGLATAKEAVKRGWTVHGLARNASAGGLAGERITLLSGDARDPVRVADALSGCDVALSAIGVKSMRGNARLFSDSIGVLIAAMKAQRLRRLVAVTGIGAGDTRGKGGFLYDWVIFPLLLGAIYADKNREEKLIRESNLDWTIVRPGILTNAKPKGLISAHTQREDYRMGRISRADVATFICDTIENGTHIREAPLIIG